MARELGETPVADRFQRRKGLDAFRGRARRIGIYRNALEVNATACVI
jgi:hypothetical protein